MDQYSHILAIAGATVGTTAVLINTATDLPPAIVRGSGLMPVEFTGHEVYSSARDLMRGILHEADPALLATLSSTALVVTASSVHSERDSAMLHAAANDAGLPMRSMSDLHWVPRGVACAYAASSPGDFLVIKAGTVAFAQAVRVGSGDSGARVGGWGSMSGDDGGAFDIGRHFLYHAFAELDGRVRSQDITGSREGFSFASNVRDVTEWIQKRRLSHSLRREVSELARIVDHVASREDNRTCRRLVEEAADRLFHSLMVAHDRARETLIGWGEGPIVPLLHGGVLENSSIFLQRLLTRLAEEASSTHLFKEPCLLAQEPVLGAANWSLAHLFSPESGRMARASLRHAQLSRPPSGSVQRCLKQL